MVGDDELDGECEDELGDAAISFCEHTFCEDAVELGGPLKHLGFVDKEVNMGETHADEDTSDEFTTVDETAVVDEDSSASFKNQ